MTKDGSASRIGAIKIDEIVKHMAHRYPFVLVDCVEDGEPSKWIRAIKNVSANEPYFRDVPRSRRSVPSLLMVEAFAQCAGILCHFSGLSKPFGQTISFFAGIEHCQYFGEARPGDRIVFECRLDRAMRGVVKLSGHGAIESEKILELSITAVLRDRDSI